MEMEKGEGGEKHRCGGWVCFCVLMLLCSRLCARACVFLMTVPTCAISCATISPSPDPCCCALHALLVPTALPDPVRLPVGILGGGSSCTNLRNSLFCS
jgi:hypothetical protein